MVRDSGANAAGPFTARGLQDAEREIPRLQKKEDRYGT